MNAVAVDLFAGGGGASLGLHRALGRPPVLAVNHDAHAIEMHRQNHPETLHLQESVLDVDPWKAVPKHLRNRVDVLWASPDCTHFSRARGGKPRKKEIRGLAWAVVEWARELSPRVIALENVPEFLTWGPLGDDGQPDKSRAGETFAEWAGRLALLGYRIEHRVLCAADYGAPTSRKRLFIVGRKDGEPVRWPAPTHGPGTGQPYRSAAECIDWSDLGHSIFLDPEEARAVGVHRPLAAATQRRIAEGVRRYVLESAEPYIAQRGTIVAGGSKHALVAAFLSKHYTGATGQPIKEPLGTITAQDHHSLGVAFLSSYYGTGVGQAPDAPLRTIPTRDRFGLVVAWLKRHGITTPPVVVLGGVPYRIADICMRMLQPEELARAQGFPDSYILTGTKSEKMARIGNSVPPQVVEAVVRAQFPPAAEVACAK